MGRVLVVDDDADLRLLWEMYLKRLGHEVYHAVDGLEALYQARYYEPDLIILDLMMPKATGWELLKHLQGDLDLRQRRRIYAGHLVVKETLGYAVSTMSATKIIGLLLRNLDWRPKQLLWTAGIVWLEAYGRYLGRRDYKAKRDHSVWEVATTTKELAGGK